MLFLRHKYRSSTLPPCLRYLAVRLSGTSYAGETIQTMLGCGHTSLLEWGAAYRSHGRDGLRDKRTGGHHRKLTSDQVIDLTHKLRQYTPSSLFGSETFASGEHWTLPDVRRAIPYGYGVT
jgi:transposase